MNTESIKGDQRVLGYISKAAPCQPLTALHPLIPSHVAGHPLGLLARKEGFFLVIALLLVYSGQIELPLLIFNNKYYVKNSLCSYCFPIFICGRVRVLSIIEDLEH